MSSIHRNSRGRTSVEGINPSLTRMFWLLVVYGTALAACWNADRSLVAWRRL